MTELLTHSRYYTETEAAVFTEKLAKAGIPFRLEVEKNVLDKIYVGESLDPLFAVKIPAGDFGRANEVIEGEIDEQFSGIHPDYYLFSFTSDELKDVIADTEQWNSLDRSLAKKILTQRNIPVLSTDSKAPQYTPVVLGTGWLMLEYLLAIAIPFAGILIGLATLYAFKVFSNGKKALMYDESSRSHARIIIIIGMIRTAYTLFF